MLSINNLPFFDLVISKTNLLLSEKYGEDFSGELSTDILEDLLDIAAHIVIGVEYHELLADEKLMDRIVEQHHTIIKEQIYEKLYEYGYLQAPEEEVVSVSHEHIIQN